MMAPLRQILTLGVLCFQLMILPGVVLAQGLVAVPSSMTHKLGAYYISALGGDLAYYQQLTGRQQVGTNPYNLVNGIADGTYPIQAAYMTSPVRGSYISRGIGGKATVDVFYKLVRCSMGDPGNCLAFERVIPVTSPGTGGASELLTVLKQSFGEGNLWLLNANQRAANAVLDWRATEEKSYVDDTFGSGTLFYKLAAPPSPCSSAKPQTYLLSVGEFSSHPPFGCIHFGGFYMLMTSNVLPGVAAMQEFGVAPELCDGTLTVFHTPTVGPTRSTGPQLVYIVKQAGAVPLTLQLVLPYSLKCQLSQNVSAVLQASVSLGQEGQKWAQAANIHLDPNLPVPPDFVSLGFFGDCAPLAYATYYGAGIWGQTNALAETTTTGNATFVQNLVRRNEDDMCVGVLSLNEPPGRDTYEDACAQLFFGDPSQRREGVVNILQLDPNAFPDEPAFRIATDLCTGNGLYTLSIQNILPQIAIDFEATRESLLAATEVKLHLDAVATNAASIIGVEAALVSCGAAFSRFLARSRPFRKWKLQGIAAKSLAVLFTSIVVTLANVPNFALVSKSLGNRGTRRVFTAANTGLYKPGNYSAVLLSETHAFVTVQGSAATAVIGLLLYGLTLLYSVRDTWLEMSEIEKWKAEAKRCLSNKTVDDGKRIVIEWRETDSRLYDELMSERTRELDLKSEVEF